MKFQIFPTYGVLLAMAFSPVILCGQTRSQEEIRQIAQSYFMQQSVFPTRGDASIEYLPSSSIVKGLHTEAFYLCNLPSEGYVLVSANASMPEILGYSSTSYHSDKGLPTGLISQMQRYASMSEGLSIAAPLSSQSSVDPMLKTRWDQSDPFNRMCPRDGNTRSVVGCVATAAAQVMKYYKWPEKNGTGKINYVTDSKRIKVSVDLSENSLAWDLMLDEYLPNQFDNAQANAVAKLMYVVGAASQMDYTNAESGASLIYAAQGLAKYFGYDNDMSLLYGDIIPADTWNELIVGEINQSRPVLFSGNDTDGEGHAFVLDGYETRNGSVYYHVNWGWSGSGDGYYLLNNLTPAGGGIGMGMGTYNESQLLLLNLHPEDGKANTLYAQSDEIQLSKTRFKSGERIMFDLFLSDLFCMHMSDFLGSLQFEFVNEKGTVLGEESMDDVDILAEESVSCTLTNFQTKSLPDGIYTVRMYLKRKDGRRIECISNKPWPRISVGNVESFIDDIEQDSTESSAYDLMGTKIKTASNQSLPAGFYVKDGRKVLVR